MRVLEALSWIHSKRRNRLGQGLVECLGRTHTPGRCIRTPTHDDLRVFLGGSAIQTGPYRGGDRAGRGPVPVDTPEYYSIFSKNRILFEPVEFRSQKSNTVTLIIFGVTK